MKTRTRATNSLAFEVIEAITCHCALLAVVLAALMRFGMLG